MGLLKHAILPFFGLTHLFLLSVVLIKGPYFAATELLHITTAYELSKAEALLIGAFAATHATLGVNCWAAVLLENAHYRRMAIVLELVYLVGDCVNFYFTLGDVTEIPPPLGMLAVLAIVGGLVHAMEPGIFTKDKNKKQKSGKSTTKPAETSSSGLRRSPRRKNN